MGGSSGALASERVGQFMLGPYRLEYTELGSGDRWVVLLPGQLMPRRMHEPLARVLASEGFHVVTLDFLGHGRSDRPEDPRVYSMTAWGEQVVALLDHLGAEQAVIGGTSLGANVSLEVADAAPERVRGLLLEMPVLDNGVEAGIAAFAPLIYIGRYLPLVVQGVALAGRLVPRSMTPFWLGIVLETMQQRPRPMSAAVHGLFFGRVAPPTRDRRRIAAPALVVGHPYDPIHLDVDAAMLAEELPNAELLTARSILEWRVDPDRLNAATVAFVSQVWQQGGGTASRSGSGRR